MSFFMITYLAVNFNTENKENLKCCVFVNPSVEKEYQMCYQCSSQYSNKTSFCPALTICQSSKRDLAQFVLVDYYNINNCNQCNNL